MPTAEERPSTEEPVDINDGGDPSELKLLCWERCRLGLPDWLVDCIWPSARPLTSKQRKRQAEKRVARKKSVAERLECWDDYGKEDQEYVRQEVRDS